MDGATILIICAFIIMDARKGFVKTFFGVFGGFFSLLFAVLLCGSVAKTLETHFGLITNLSARLNGTLSGIFGNELMNTPLSEASTIGSNTASWLLKIINNLGVASELADETTIGSVICPVFAYYIIAILGAIILFIVFKLLFFVLGEIVHKLHAFAPIKTADTVLGLLMGLLQGVIVVQSVLMILKIIPVAFCQSAVLEIENTVVLRLLNNGNVFEMIINALLKSNLTDTIIGLIK